MKLLPPPPIAEGYVNIPVGLTFDRKLKAYEYVLWGMLSQSRFNEVCVAVDLAEMAEMMREPKGPSTPERVERGLRLLVKEGWLIRSVKTTDGKQIYRVTGGTEAKRSAAWAKLDERERPFLVKA